MPSRSFVISFPSVHTRSLSDFVRYFRGSFRHAPRAEYAFTLPLIPVHYTSFSQSRSRLRLPTHLFWLRKTARWSSSSRRNGKEFRDVDWRAMYDTVTTKKSAFVFDGRIILDGDALRKIGFKVTTIGRQLDLRQKHAGVGAVVGDSVVLRRRPRGLLWHFVETAHIIQLRPFFSPSCVILIYALCVTNKNIRDIARYESPRAIQDSCAHRGPRHPSELDKLLHVRQWKENHRQKAPMCISALPP